MGADTRSEEEMEEIEEKVEDKLKKLGNIIDDVLLMLEQEAIGTGKDSFTKKRITTLIDIYAEEFDEILRKHGVGMGSEIKKLMTSLLDDLEKIINSEEVE
jgi:hypothetical protein